MAAQSDVAPETKAQDLLAKVNAYYEQTRFDYYSIWLNSSNLALHFGYYDQNATTHRAALENANRVLAKLAGIHPGDRVLDAGCGLGGSGCWLASRLGAEVTGVTAVARQAEEARKIVARKV